jgi:pimeloyl-ACP methyl ester carboxylesterase
MAMGLAADIGGTGAPNLVLSHGLGATREVWRGLCEHLSAGWPGRWIALDLPGHGRSPPGPSYEPHAKAAAVVQTLLEIGGGRPLVVLGHSMGGVVALALAGGQLGLLPTLTLAPGNTLVLK